MNWNKGLCLCHTNKNISLLRGFRNKQSYSFWNEVMYRRSFNTGSINGAGNGINIFDRQSKIHQKNVAARYSDHDVFDYIKMEVMFYKEIDGAL